MDSTGHIQEVHDGKKTFACDVSKSAFGTKSNIKTALVQLIQLMFMKRKPIVCSVFFRRKIGLQEMEYCQANTTGKWYLSFMNHFDVCLEIAF